MYSSNNSINYLKQKFDELGINYIDNTELLKEKSKNNIVFNKKYDAGHWNDIGAFYGINNVYNRLIDDGFNINKLNKKDYNLNYEKVTSLPVSEFTINEKIPNFELKTNNFVIIKNYNNLIKLNNKASYYLESENNKVDNNYTVLFFRDSYINRKEKFISNIFSKIYYVHSYHNAINVDYYYNILNPDIVWIDAVEYAINDSYYPANNINNKIYNKSYDVYKNLEKDNFTELHLNKINQKIKNNHKKKIKLTTININKSDFKYAYLRVNKNKIYDFIYKKNSTYITLDTDLLKNSNSIDIILINNDETNII